MLVRLVFFLFYLPGMGAAVAIAVHSLIAASAIVKTDCLDAAPFLRAVEKPRGALGPARRAGGTQKRTARQMFEGRGGADG